MIREKLPVNALSLQEILWPVNDKLELLAMTIALELVVDKMPLSTVHVPDLIPQSVSGSSLTVSVAKSSEKVVQGQRHGLNEDVFPGVKINPRDDSTLRRSLISGIHSGTIKPLLSGRYCFAITGTPPLSRTM